MNLNRYQKIILAIFGLCLVYFAVLHVPFRNDNDEIEYDTLFSTNSNLVVGRLVLIIVILVLLFAVLFFLVKNLSLTIKLRKPTKTAFRKLILFLLLIIIVASATVYITISHKPKYVPNVSVARADSISLTPDSSSAPRRSALARQLDDKKAETCTKDNALFQFRSYMKFYYPDWKIYGKPQVKESTEGFESPCSYQIQFTTSDPHMQYITEKEVIVVQIAFTFDYSGYRFSTIRGTLY